MTFAILRNKIYMKLIYSKFASQNIMWRRCLQKMERRETSHNKLKEAGTSQKQLEDLTAN